MLVNNGSFTDEQVEIITAIGKKQREEKEKIYKKQKVFMLFHLIIITSVSLILYWLGDNIVQPLFIFVIGIGVGIHYYKATISRFDKQYEQDDFNLGLTFADKNKEVVGNSKKELKRNGIAYLILGPMFILLSIFMFFMFDDEGPVNYDDLDVVTGKLASGEYSSDTITMYLRHDDTRYQIGSIYTDTLDIDAIFDEVGIGDDVIFYTEYFKTVDGKDIRNVYYYEANGTVYMSETQMIDAYTSNQNLGVIMMIVCAVIGVGMIIGYLIYKNFVVSHNQKKEVYDLNPQIVTSKEDDLFNNINIKRIETYAPKWLIGLVIGMVVVLIILSILTFLYITDTQTKIVISAILFGLAIGMLILLHNSVKNNEVLEGEYFTFNRYFKTRKIHISEIKKISITPISVNFYDSKDKKIVAMDKNTGNLDLICEELSDLGILVTLENR